MPSELEILLLDNDPSGGDGVEFALRRAGHRIRLHRIETIGEFKASLRQSRPDVILCKFCVPKVSALEALQALKESGADLPFIVLSSNSADEQSRELFRFGAHGLVSLDELDHLAPVVERELNAARSRAEEAAAAGSP